MGFKDFIKKIIKSISHGGIFAKARLFTIDPVPDSLKEKAEKVEGTKGIFNPNNITLNEILSNVTIFKTIIEVVSNRRIGLSHNILLTITPSNPKMFRMNYPHEIKANPLTNFNGAIVFHTTSRRDNIADIAYENMVLRGWSAIGYHFIILQDGTIINTRPITLRGDHAYGFNDSIGVAFAKNLTKLKLSEEEVKSAKILVRYLKRKLRVTRIYGHRTAQLEAIELMLRKILAKNKSFSSQIMSFINQINVIQRMIHLDHFLPNEEIEIDLLDLIKFAKSAPLEIKKQLFIGDRPLLSYMKGIKKCPGRFFKFKFFLRLRLNKI